MRALRSVSLIALLLATPAVAADKAADPVAGPKDDVVVTLGGGLRVNPDWDGSQKYILAPFPIVGLKFLRSPLTGQPSSDIGFGLAPSVRLLSKRSFDRASPLFGLPDVGTAFEAGLTVDYTDTWFRGFVSARQGMGGHHGQVFDLGLDGIVRPMPKLKLEAGPRLSLATAEYMRTYFGVSAADSARTGIAAYDPKGGVRAYGLGGVATWEIDKNWFVRADAAWNRLSDEATRSPVIRRAGARDQFTAGLGIAYRFGTGWH